MRRQWTRDFEAAWTSNTVQVTLGDQGAQGPKGDPGAQGPKGDQGPAGRDAKVTCRVSAPKEGKKKTPTVGVVPGTCFAQVEFAGVLHNAKNPAGAQALIDFMLTKPYQEGIPLQMYVYPAVTGTKLPPVFTQFAPQPDASSLSADEIGAHRTEWIDEWTQIVLQ